MGKSPTVEQQQEFARLRAFVAAVFDDVLASQPHQPEHHPGAVADRMWARSPALAVRGIRAAASDCVEMLQDLDGPELAAFEARLSAAGAPALSEMRNRTRKDRRIMSNARRSRPSR